MFTRAETQMLHDTAVPAEVVEDGSKDDDDHDENAPQHILVKNTFLEVTDSTMPFVRSLSDGYFARRPGSHREHFLAVDDLPHPAPARREQPVGEDDAQSVGSVDGWTEVNLELDTSSQDCRNWGLTHSGGNSASTSLDFGSSASASTSFGFDSSYFGQSASSSLGHGSFGRRSSGCASSTISQFEDSGSLAGAKATIEALAPPPMPIGNDNGVVPRWSAGSQLHGKGECKPCLFLKTKSGCLNGTSCRFCHQPHEKRPRMRPCKSQRVQCKQMVRMLAAALGTESEEFTLASERLAQRSSYMRSLLKTNDVGGALGSQHQPKQNT